MLILLWLLAIPSRDPGSTPQGNYSTPTSRDSPSTLPSFLSPPSPAPTPTIRLLFTTLNCPHSLTSLEHTLVIHNTNQLIK